MRPDDPFRIDVTDQLPTFLSPSAASTYQQCPKQFYYKYILGIRTPGTIHTHRGTLVHTALERIFDHPPQERTVETTQAYLGPALESTLNPFPERSEVDDEVEIRLRDAEGRWADEVTAGTKKHDRAMRDAENLAEVLDEYGTEEESGRELLLGEMRVLVANWFTMEDPRVFEPHAQEIYVRAEAAGVPLHGFIDRLDRVTLRDGREVYVVSDYKGLARDTPLPTPDGWTTMGAVAVGDSLLGTDGRPTVVTEKSSVHNRPCYEVTFDDGSSVVADNVHLWQVAVGSRRREQVLSTEQIAALLEEDRRGVTRPIVIPNPAPLDLPERDLLVEPYTLGVWLGDGHTGKTTLTQGRVDADAMMKLLADAGTNVSDVTDTTARNRGVRVLNLKAPAVAGCTRGHSDDSMYRNKRGHKTRCTACQRLRDAGVIGAHPRKYAAFSHRLGVLGVLHDKRVPAEYLRASASQRLALLQGLMDTDGSYHDQRRRSVFVSTTEQLADAVHELVCSLGGRASRHTGRDYETKNNGTKRAYQVSFTLPDGLDVFRLPRKLEQLTHGRDVTNRTRSTRRAIVGATRVESVPTQCVKVDSENSLYLCGRQMVPTHNTGKLPQDRYLSSKFFQLKVYALLLREIHGYTPRMLRLIYVKGQGSDAIKKLPLTDAVLDRTAAQVKSLWRGINTNARSNIWPTKTSALCPWCDFQPVCPAFNDGTEGLLAEEQELYGLDA